MLASEPSASSPLSPLLNLFPSAARFPERRPGGFSPCRPLAPTSPLLQLLLLLRLLLRRRDARVELPALRAAVVARGKVLLRQPRRQREEAERVGIAARIVDAAFGDELEAFCGAVCDKPQATELAFGV